MLTACSEFVEIDAPINSLVQETTFSSDNTATAVMTGLYKDIAVDFGLASGGPSSSLAGYCGMLTDELEITTSSTKQLEFYTNSISISNSFISGLWEQVYNYIYRANSVIEGVSSSTLSNHVKQQLEGEAKFTRAFMYFYLVNTYGGVPLSLTTDYDINNSLSRSIEDEVYTQIIQDLTDAEQLLTEEYMSANNEITEDRVRPNKFAATALLARVYLYLEDWANAEAKASVLIENQTTYNFEDYENTFLAGSKAAIWQVGVGPNASGLNTWDGMFYFFYYRSYFMTDDLNAVLIGDNRSEHWTKSFTQTNGEQEYYPYKYKIAFGNRNGAVTELTMVLRLAEQYLIRAEARARQGKFDGISGGNIDLNTIRNRGGMPSVTPSTIVDFMPILENERRKELFAEWGHRWFDIKRWPGFTDSSISRADEIMPAILNTKGGEWNTEKTLWPIPESELLININLHQNPGY